MNKKLLLFLFLFVFCSVSVLGVEVYNFKNDLISTNGNKGFTYARSDGNTWTTLGYVAGCGSGGVGCYQSTGGGFDAYLGNTTLAGNLTGLPSTDSGRRDVGGYYIVNSTYAMMNFSLNGTLRLTGATTDGIQFILQKNGVTIETTNLIATGNTYNFSKNFGVLNTNDNLSLQVFAIGSDNGDGFDLVQTTINAYPQNNTKEVKVFSENTGLQFTQNVQATVLNNGTTANYTINSGSKLIDFNGGISILSLSSSGYQSRSYIIDKATAPNVINTYLLASNDSTTFTVVDADLPSLVLENVLFQAYTTINGSLTLVESQYSNVVGKVVFDFNPASAYSFTFSLDGYLPKTVSFTTITDPDYTITLNKLAGNQSLGQYTDASVSFMPNNFKNNANNVFNITFFSSNGTLTAYGFNLSWSGGSVAGTGNSSNGQQFNNFFTIGNTGYGQKANLTYFYNSTSAGYLAFSTQLEIYSNQTGLFMQNKDKTYGMGLFERVLIVTIITFFIVGIGATAAGLGAGLMLGMLIIGFFLYIGLIPIQAFVISLVVGFMLLAFSGGI